ncbi:universal stress protein [Sediminicola sp. 1XM1-17]|uniref:universal stress protein n=1 Tax=Sediminicola sp. 1XM1-17 TaxID=3127702 RepID=UPI003077781F
MKRILLPTDFSKNAWNAISYTLAFFKNENCTFYILHTYTPSFYRVDYMLGGPTFSAIADARVEESVKGLEKTLRDIQKKYANPKHQFETLSAFNILTDEINEVVENKEIDLIVMGTQGATGAKDLFIGTNTIHVIRKAQIPVLAIPADYKFKEIQKIVFATDYWAKYKKEEIAPLISLTKIHKAKLIVLHVMEEMGLWEKQEENKQVLKDYLGDLSHSFDQMSSKHVADAIQEYMENNQLDLLAMQNRKHHFWERLLMRQNVSAIGFHLKVPFLVLRDTGKSIK